MSELNPQSYVTYNIGVSVTVINNNILFLEGVLKPAEKLTFIVLAGFAALSKHEAFPSYAKLAACVGLKERRQIDVVTSLIEKGFLIKTKRRDVTGSNMSNVYMLTLPNLSNTDYNMQHAKIAVSDMQKTKIDYAKIAPEFKDSNYIYSDSYNTTTKEEVKEEKKVVSISQSQPKTDFGSVSDSRVNSIESAWVEYGYGSKLPRHIKTKICVDWKDIPDDLYIYILGYARENGGKTFAYAKKIIDKCMKLKLFTVDDFEANNEQYREERRKERDQQINKGGGYYATSSNCNTSIDQGYNTNGGSGVGDDPDEYPDESIYEYGIRKFYAILARARGEDTGSDNEIPASAT
jgi:DNA replication protein DnaD